VLTLFLRLQFARFLRWCLLDWAAFAILRRVVDLQAANETEGETGCGGFGTIYGQKEESLTEEVSLLFTCICSREDAPNGRPATVWPRRNKAARSCLCSALSLQCSSSLRRAQKHTSRRLPLAPAALSCGASSSDRCWLLLAGLNAGRQLSERTLFLAEN